MGGLPGLDAMITIITDRRSDNEPEMHIDKSQPLTLRDLEGRAVATVDAPSCGWSHLALCEAARRLCPSDSGGLDAFVGQQWVGGTEV